MKLVCRSTVPAFTLWELMIAMLITSLIVALSYGAYWKFSSALQQESDQAEQLHDLRLLERDLFRLSQECTAITREGDVLVFNFPEKLCYLEFSDSTLVLVTEGSGEGYEFALDNRPEEEKVYPIDAWNASYLNKHTKHIDRFRIRYQAGRQVYPLSFRKTYSNSFLYSLNQP